MISLEPTDTGQLLLPILAVLIARAMSGLVCATPIYRCLAEPLPAPTATHPLPAAAITRQHHLRRCRT